MNKTQDLFLNGKVRLMQPESGHRSGTDAVLLAAFCQAQPGNRVADLGAGVGVAGLCLHARVPTSRLLFIEINADLCKIAQENAPFAEILTLDIKQRSLMPANQFDHVIINPPYNPASMQMSDNLDKRLAHEGIDLVEWIKTAAHLLHAKGRITLIDRPERLLEILSSLDKRFGAIEIMPVFTGRRQATRLLIRAEKGVKTPLSILPAFDVQKNGEAILRHAEALP